ncbi:cellulase family glycosylhydrolase [Sphingomonas xinjiangensis]
MKHSRTPSAKFQTSYGKPARINELRTLTEYARSRGVRMILDNHTYQWKSVQEQVSFWTTFARNFPDDGSIVLDLVNEPGGFNDPVLTNDWMQWIRDAKLVISGLPKNGVNHPMAIQYPQWSAAFRFDKAEPISGIVIALVALSIVKRTGHLIRSIAPTSMLTGTGTRDPAAPTRSVKRSGG